MSSRDDVTLDAQRVLASWNLDGAELERDKSGHINRTYRLTLGRERYILQWLNPIFDAVVNRDIQAITSRLDEQGLLTPRLLPTVDGDLWVEDEAGGVWRVLTFVDGHTVLAADSPERCAAAGRLLGEFHAALWDFPYRFHFTRLGVHHTAQHLATLDRALEQGRGHRLYDSIAPLAEKIQQELAALDFSQDLPRRLVHGDPKISNFIFSASGDARCLVDLDTLARMPLAFELGDAFRSWCCPVGEDAPAVFLVDHFEAGLKAYAGAIGPRPALGERLAIPLFVQVISLELAARFCADALCESYFGWDRERYSSAAEHNLDRTRSQLALGLAVAQVRGELEKLVSSAWS